MLVASHLECMSFRLQELNVFETEGHFKWSRYTYEGPAKVSSLGSEYFSAMFFKHIFYYKPSKYPPFTETHFCNLFIQSRKADT